MKRALQDFSSTGRVVIILSWQLLLAMETSSSIYSPPPSPLRAETASQCCGLNVCYIRTYVSIYHEVHSLFLNAKTTSSECEK